MIKLVHHQVILDKKLNFVLLDNQVFYTVWRNVIYHLML